MFPPLGPLEFIATDILGPLRKVSYSNQYVMLFTDHYTKLTREIPVTKVSPTYAVSVLIDQCVILYGTKRHLLTENGPQLVSYFFTAVFEYFPVGHLTTTAYHPQTNGRANGLYRRLSLVFAITWPTIRPAGISLFDH